MVKLSKKDIIERVDACCTTKTTLTFVNGPHLGDSLCDLFLSNIFQVCIVDIVSTSYTENSTICQVYSYNKEKKDSLLLRNLRQKLFTGICFVL